MVGDYTLLITSAKVAQNAWHDRPTLLEDDTEIFIIRFAFFSKIKIEKLRFGCPSALTRRPNCSQGGFITLLTCPNEHSTNE